MRDPRIDPMPGDVLANFGRTRTTVSVISASPHNVWFRVVDGKRRLVRPEALATFRHMARKAVPACY